MFNIMKEKNIKTNEENLFSIYKTNFNLYHLALIHFYLMYGFLTYGFLTYNVWVLNALILKYISNFVCF